MSSATEWRYVVDGQQQGPVSEAELGRLAASGRLKPTDFVWRPGLSQWIPASQVPGLFAVVEPVTPEASDWLATDEKPASLAAARVFKPSAPIHVAVKSSSPGVRKGAYTCTIRSDGLVLTQKAYTLNLPVGTSAQYKEGGEFTATLDGKTLRIQPSGFQSLTRYNHKLCRDLARFLQGRGPAPVLSEYSLPWYLSVLTLLPLVIPLGTGFGLFPTLFGVLGAMASGWIAQQEKLGNALRMVLMGLVFGGTLAATIVLIAAIRMTMSDSGVAKQDDGFAAHSQPQMPNRPPEAAAAQPPRNPVADPAKLKKIQACWRTHPRSRPANLLSSMQGADRRAADGSVVLTAMHRLVTPKSYSTPVAFRIVAQIDSTNIRISHPANQIIFNWEMRQDELRIDGGPAAGRHKRGAGRVPTHEWIGIELVVLPQEMIVYVDGTERYRTAADFSKVNAPLALWTMGTSVLQVKSVEMVRP